MKWFHPSIHGWLLVLPATCMLMMFTHIPAVLTVIHSFYTGFGGAREPLFVGLENYQVMLEDEVFLKVMRNNFIYALVTIPCTIGLSLVMALWVNSRLIATSWMRLSFFAPTILPMIAVANIWIFFFTPEYGMIEQVRAYFGGDPVNWLGNPNTALAAIMIVAIWKDAGFFMIFYLAAMQQISPSLGEAAYLEGASRWYYFRKVLFPLLMPTTLFVMVNSIINAFRLVDHIFAMTKGGPDNGSALLLFYIWDMGFKFWDTGYAAALTVLLVLILATVTFVQFNLLDKKVHYQ